MARNEYMTGMHPAYSYPEKFQPQAEEFFKTYVLEREVGCPDQKMTNLAPPRERVCRFCGQKYPAVTFKKDAHTFSEFLGNRYRVSDFECDTCNAKFGVYEDHFSKFLGIARTMLSVKGKEKIPKFKSPGEKLILESTPFDNSQTTIHAKRSEVLDQTFEFDKVNKTTKVHFTKHPYVPLMVYKALLKMALSCINPKEASAYKMAFEFLKDNRHDRDWTGMALVYRYSLPYTFCYLKPSGFLFRKRDPSSQAYTHVFVLHALNAIYEFIIPFHFYDLQHANKKDGLILPWCPPIFGMDYPFPMETIQQAQIDLSSPDTVKGEKESIAFSAPEESYETARFIDKVTGEIREEEFDGSKIRGIDFLRTKLGSPPPEDI